MALLPRTLLGLSLAVSVAGVPTPSTMFEVPDLCHEGTMKCNQDTVYTCQNSGWIEFEHCGEPSWCKSDISGNAWCTTNLELRKRAAPAPTSTVTTAPSTKADGPLGRCSESQTRCNGKDLQICNNNDKWEAFQQCSECKLEGDHHSCIAPTTSTVVVPTTSTTVTSTIVGPTTSTTVVTTTSTVVGPTTSTVVGPTTSTVVGPTASTTVTSTVVVPTTSTDVVTTTSTDVGPTTSTTVVTTTSTDVVTITSTDVVTTTSTTVVPTATPECTRGETRCNGNNFELCDGEPSKWTFVENCKLCSTDNGMAYCQRDPDTPPPAQPTPSSSFSPAWDDPCFSGEVRCVGSDRIEACSAERNWEDFGPCPNCKQRYNTAVTCSFDDAGLSNFWTVGSSPTPTLKSGLSSAGECDQGFQRCARGNTTVETCDKGQWTTQGCVTGQVCVGIHSGIAWCST
ncbi:hypothetical protein F4818DRAFT_268565 [Hypoxylon cercidicola]|nr:hypothetical protein F4818DRAFT_268565 [Hypoxylon cercidicola]